MPRLPTLDDLGSRPVPVSNRRIISDPGAGVVGQVLEGFGQTVGKIGAQFQEKEDRLSYAAAKSAVLKADVAARQELQDDPDYETWGARYTDKMKAAREAASKLIGSHSDRRMFEADAELDTMRGGAELGKLASARRVNARQGTLTEGLNNLQDVGINAPDDATREATIANANELINAGVKDGTIDAVRGVELRRGFTQNYVLQRVEALRTQGDLEGAQKFFDANRSRIDPAAEMRLNEQLHDATENRQNLTIAEDVVYNRGSAANDPYSKYAIVSNPDKSTWDKRADGSAKGEGWLGLRQRPDGGVSSEISVGVEINGKEQDIPLMVPGLSKSELDYLMTHDPDQEKNPNFIKDMPRSIMQKAETFAKQRINQGKSPFRQSDEPMNFGATQADATGKPANQRATVATNVAREFGLKPTEVAAVMSYETGGSFSPTVMGGKDGNYMGLIQFGPSERAKYGITKNSSPADWTNAITSYLHDRGFKPGMGLLDLYSTINAGKPGRYNASDGNGTVRSHVDKILNEHTAKAEAWLGGQSPSEHDLNSIYSTIDERAKNEGWTPERREAVKAQAARLVDRDEGLLRRQQNDAFEGALAKADALGKDFTDPSQLGDAFYKASPTDQHRLRAMAQANAAPKEPEANGSVIRSLHVMAIEAPDKLAQANLAQYKPFMTAGEFDEISQAQARAKTQPAQGAWNPRSGIQQAIGWGKTFGGVELKDGENLYRVYRYMEARAREQSAQNGGKPPTENDYQSFFREATREVKVTRSFMGVDALAPDTTMRAYQLPSANMKALITRQFKAQFGRNPNDAEIQQWFDRMGETLK